jgi:outer membrane protein OmpA-like peptidoglycan-associated protein
LGIDGSDESRATLVLPGEIGIRTNRPLPVTGRGCIVAALDFGLDFAHPNFLNPDGTTRLVAFWHQGATYDASHPNRFGYGRVYSREEINAALRASDPYQALGYHPAISDTGNGSHGTHTLDIASGNADLIFVHLSMPRLGIVGDLGNSVHLLEALDFVDTTARFHLLPWVANVSVGRTAGSHDGTSPVEQGMHELLRLGPDRAIVQSAGNYRSADLAVQGWLRDGEHRELGWIIDPRDTTGNEIDVWYSGKDRFVVAIQPPEEQDFVEVKLGDVADLRHKGDLVGRIYHRRNDPNARDNHVEGILYPGAPPGVWTVRLIGEYVISGRFHAWVERDLARPGAQSRFDSGITSQSYTLGTIATSPLVITVGAYDANAEETPLAPFSSCGPTRDERRDKPELLAPGVDVVAARSIPRDALRQEGLLIARSGTSMAAPHVTRTVAAMLAAADRPVSIDEIRDCLKRSAEPVADREHANCCAWGRLNPAGAIREILELKKTALISAPQGDALVPELPVTTSGPAISDAATGDFARASEEQEIEVSKDEGVLMNGVTIDRFLERAEHALRSSYGGRRESETAFLQRLLRELGHGAPADLSPAELFRAALHDGPLMRSAQDLLRVLAVPPERPPEVLRAGDWMLRAVPGTGDVGHVSVLASDDLLTESRLAAESIAAESTQPGYYGLVIEAGALPHSRLRPFARRLLDSRGRVPQNTVFLRPEVFQAGAAIPTPEVALPVGQGGWGDIEASPPATLPRALGGPPDEETLSTGALLPELRIGAVGPTVQHLQIALNAADANPQLALDGDFGPLTQEAVLSFQHAHGLIPDGIVGPKTWKVLENVIGPPKSLPDILGDASALDGSELAGSGRRREGLTLAGTSTQAAAARSKRATDPLAGLKGGAQGPTWVNVHSPTGLIGQVFFVTDESSLDDQDFEELQEIIDRYPPLLNIKRVIFSFHGFADHRFTKEHNQRLSEARAKNVKDFIEQGLFKHPSYVPEVRGFGIHPESKFFPPTSEALAGFRRVDIHAEPISKSRPRPTPRKPDKPRIPSLRWKARILSSLAADHTLGVDTFRMQIVDLDNNISMVFRYTGISVSAGLPLSASASSEFVEFETSQPIRIRNFEGFARHTSAQLQPAGGISTDFVHLLGPWHCCGADSVYLEFTGVSRFGEGFGVGAGTSIGGFEAID